MSNTNKVHALCDFFASVFFYGALTHLRGGGIYSDSFLTNCLIILPVKNYNNWLIFGEVMRRTIIVPFWPTL